MLLLPGLPRLTCAPAATRYAAAGVESIPEASANGRTDFLIEGGGQSPIWFQERPNLDASQARGGEHCGQPDRLVQIAGVEEGEPAQLLLRLGERTVGH